MKLKLSLALAAVMVLAGSTMHSAVQARLKTALEFTGAMSKSAPAAFATMSCSDAMAKLRARGFGDVAATDCDGSQFRFNVTRKGRNYTVVMHAQSGGMTTITR